MNYSTIIRKNKIISNKHEKIESNFETIQKNTKKNINEFETKDFIINIKKSEIRSRNKLIYYIEFESKVKNFEFNVLDFKIHNCNQIENIEELDLNKQKIISKIKLKINEKVNGYLVFEKNNINCINPKIRFKNLQLMLQKLQKQKE